MVGVSMPHWPTLHLRGRSGDRVAPRTALRRVAALLGALRRLRVDCKLDREPPTMTTQTFFSFFHEHARNVLAL